MPDPAATDRPLPGRQREARSNDAAVLVAAREVFSARGHDASMAEIARHAGVGVALEDGPHWDEWMGTWHG